MKFLKSPWFWLVEEAVCIIAGVLIANRQRRAS